MDASESERKKLVDRIRDGAFHNMIIIQHVVDLIERMGQDGRPWEDIAEQFNIIKANVAAAEEEFRKLEKDLLRETKLYDPKSEVELDD